MTKATKTMDQPGNSVHVANDTALVSRRVKAWTSVVVTLVGLGIGAVVWAYTSFESQDTADAKATVHSAAFGEHKAGTHEKTVADLHKFEVRVQRVEIEHEYRGKQMIYLVREIKKIGDQVGSRPAPPPTMPDAALAAEEKSP